MKITLCGSIAFYDEMLDIQKKLEEMSHEVKLPPCAIKDENGGMISVKEYYNIRKSLENQLSWVWERKKEAMKSHFDKIVWSDAILVLNFTKKDILNYIGANTLLEMGIALYFDKKIYLFNDIPEIGYKEEILGVSPIVIHQDLRQIV